MGLRPLGIAKEIVETLRLEITYTYDDLVFVEHNAFLLQFDDDQPNHLKLFFNVECEQAARDDIEAKLAIASREREFRLSNCGDYQMDSDEKTKELKLTFS